MVRGVQKAKAETNKSAAGDKSPSRSSTRDKSASRTLRKSPSRSETVTSKEVAPKSPVRKSPSRRSPSRRSPIHKSPARKSPSRKSPTRKSPSRKSPTRGSPTVRSSLSRKPRSTRLNKKLTELDSDSDDTELDYVNTEKPKATVRGRARKSESEYFLPKDIQSSVVQDVSNFGVVLRSATKLPTSNDVERVVHLKNDLAVKKLTEFSDEDEIPLKRRSISVREQSEDFKLKSEAGSWLGALIAILTIPITFVILYASCNETHCKFTQLPNLNKFKHWSSWFDSTAFLIYLGYISLVAILSATPIGGRRVSGLLNKQGKLNYVMNGFFIATVTSALLVALEYYKVPVISHILDKYFQLIVTATIIGVLISIYLYAHSFYVPISALNPHAISNSKIYNFFIGREINPRIYGKLDMKIFLFRTFIISMLLLNAIFIYKSLQFTAPIEIQNYNLKGVKYNSTLLVIGALQMFYAIDLLIYEKSMLTTFEVQYEALGYMSTVSMLAGSLITPLITKYVYDYQIKLPIWHLSAAVVVYLIGYILYRGSNNQKHIFRINPLDPAVAHLEKIPTAQGKKLLVSGYWGFVRHPNYLGDILMFLSFASFVWKCPAVLICVIDIVFLIQRSHRDGKRCKERYGSAWNRYCQRVKYVLIPKIY